MPQARRMSQRLTDEERAAIRHETLAEVRDALDKSTDFDDFRDAMEESDSTLPGLTMAEISGMTVEQVNENWQAVSAVLAGGPDGFLEHTGEQPPPGPRNTGQQLLADGGGGGVGGARVPLSRSALAAMSHQEIIDRKDEIDAWLSNGGANR